MKFISKKEIAFTILSTSFAFLFIFFSIDLITTYFTKKTQIEQIIVDARNNIISSDLRSIETSMLARIPQDFHEITLSSPEQNLHITYQKGTSRPLKLLSINYPLYYDETQASLWGEILFKYNVFDNLTRIIYLWLLSTFLAIPFIIYFFKKVSSKALEEVENEKLRAIGSLSLQVAHDIRSPLAVLKNVELKDNELARIALYRLEDIANDLLKNKRDLNTPKINHSDVFKSLIEEKKIAYSNKSPIISFVQELTLPAHLTSKVSDLTRLLSNLLNNAIEASAHPIIEIRTQKTELHFQILIKDNGCGIPQDLLEKLGKESITTKAEGNGLGLLSAFQKMKEWGGELKIESTPNVGTTIILNFPINNTQPALTVLVDDDALVRLNWEARAKKSQVHFRVFSTAQELMETLETLPKDTRFYLDLEIKNSSHSGLELAKILKSKGFYDLHLASGHEQIESDLFLTQRNKSCPF